MRTGLTRFKTMAAERGATTSADVEVKGLSADGFQQSYSRGRVLKTFRDNGVYVERCIVEQCDVSVSRLVWMRRMAAAAHVGSCSMLAIHVLRAHVHDAHRRMRVHAADQVDLTTLGLP